MKQDIFFDINLIKIIQEHHHLIDQLRLKFGTMYFRQ